MLLIACSVVLAPVGSARAGETATDAASRLVQAARAADADTVRRLLEGGADANTPDAHVTPLIGAAASARDGDARLDVIRMLLAAGARVNGQTADGQTALSFAAAFVDSDAVRVLLERGHAAIGRWAIWRPNVY